MSLVFNFINDLAKHGLNLFPNSVARVREAIRYVRQSRARVEFIKECSRVYWKEFDRSGEFRDRAREYRMKSESFLILDCPTRWTSTYEMLKASKTFEEAFDLYEDKDSLYKHHMVKTCGVPEYDEWENVTSVKKILKGFYKASKNVSDLYLTSNRFFHEIGEIDFHIDNIGRCNVSRGLDMKMKFYKYWGDVEDSNMLIHVANILDPRQKLVYIEFYFANMFKHDYTDEGEKMWKHEMRKVLTSLYDVFDAYKGKIEGPQGNADAAKSRIFMEKYLAKEDGACTSRLMKGKPLLGRNVKGLTELDKYLNEDSLQNAHGLDLLKWWKKFSGQFPILYKVAKDVLAFSISAVKLESGFSTDGNVLNDFRSSLSHSMVEDLVCTQDWICELEEENESG